MSISTHLAHLKIHENRPKYDLYTYQHCTILLFGNMVWYWLCNALQTAQSLLSIIFRGFPILTLNRSRKIYEYPHAWLLLLWVLWKFIWQKTTHVLHHKGNARKAGKRNSIAFYLVQSQTEILDSILEAFSSILLLFLSLRPRHF